MSKKDKKKKKRPTGKTIKETQTVQLTPAMWDALSKEAEARGISRNQWIKVILSHRKRIIEAEEEGQIDPTL